LGQRRKVAGSWHGFAVGLLADTSSTSEAGGSTNSAPP